MKPVAFDYLAATDPSAAASALEQRNSMAMAGGQSLGPMLNLRLARPRLLVGIETIDEFTQIETHPKHTLYGALTTHASFEDGKVVDVTNGMMAHVAGGIAFRPVRNRGTIGGSLAHADPAADWVSTAVVLDAKIVTTQREFEASSFMLAPFTTALEAGELIRGVAIPHLSASARWGYRKFCRKTGEFADAIGAVVLDKERGVARAVLGAVDGPPLSLPSLAETLLLGHNISTETIQSEVAEAVPEADRTAQHLYAVMLARAIEDVHS